SVTLVVVSLSMGIFVLLYIRRVSEKLYRLTESLANSSTQVAALSDEVCSASETTAEGARQQATALGENASAGARVSALTKRNVTSTNSMAAVISTAGQQVPDANGTLTAMLSSMKEITGASE